VDASALTNVAFAGIAVFGAVLTGLGFLAVRRAPSPRMMLVSGGFLLITIQGVLVGLGLFLWAVDAGTLLLVSALFEAGVLVVLFLATLVR
jgi:hypothetical protein